MSRWILKFVAIAIVVCGRSQTAIAYEDDDLLCRPGWSPELYEQQIREQHFQQRMTMAQYQFELANAAAVQQRSTELARLSRQRKAEKDARRREEMIAKRKIELAGKPGSGKATPSQAVLKP